LSELAASTGGTSFQATDEAGLAAAWRAIDSLERAPIVRREGVVLEPLLSAASLALLLVMLCCGALTRLLVRSVP
jgi:hypothetical protein